ncbi:MAG: hypothetical protein LBK61_00585 [Spirochaetaceae bacterium]|nr:hypothetical protein [Spirochaetaceae bacterium]
MAVTQAAETGNPPSVETVLAILAELGAKMDRQSEEAEKRRAEWQKEAEKRQEEADRRQAEWQKEAEKRQKEAEEQAKKRAEEAEKRRAEAAVTMEELKRTVDRVTKSAGRFANAIGELTEILVAARLWEKFPEYDLKRVYRQVPVYDENGHSKTEIDILLSNTDCAMAVEVKTSLVKTGQVDWHLKRMDLIRQYPPAEIAINGKRLLGAIAGGVVDASVVEYAQQCGLFVLELSGETARRLPAPDGFTPREW